MRTYDDETLIIFVTNLSQYAVKGYEVGALDFVVKPVSYHNLSMRLDRAMVTEAGRLSRLMIARRSSFFLGTSTRGALTNEKSTRPTTAMAAATA